VSMTGLLAFSDKAPSKKSSRQRIIAESHKAYRSIT